MSGFHFGLCNSWHGCVQCDVGHTEEGHSYLDWSHVYVSQQAKGEGASHPNAIHQLRIAVAEEAASVIAARVQAVDVQYRLCQPFTAPLVMPATK